MAGEDLSKRLSELGEAMRSHLDRVHEGREAALQGTRRATQLSARAIRAGHRGQLGGAKELAGEARAALIAASEALRPFPDVYQSGFVQDAEKEVAEAHITIAMVGEERVPGPEDVGVAPASYLNGLAEAASELRRAALDALRASDVDRAGRSLEHMDEAYGLLITLDYPEAVTHGLRRNTDMLRGVLERTRGDVTLAYRQVLLEQMLARVEQSSDSE
ncbi:MAG: haloacid dehalogenase [Chloroflexota bacterium]